MADIELLDAGDGRRLERFGRLLVDRPAPGATERPALPRRTWQGADLCWSQGRWTRGADRDPWMVEAADLRLECRPASGGQVGVFAEHAATWTWLGDAVGRLTTDLGREPAILSLFAYTGGATLVAAAAGARVTHVDASRTAVAWARRNALASGLDDRPVRWLADDVRDVVRRERRRGRTYDGVILDPPTYGHGSTPWKIDVDLPPLLDDLAALVGPRPNLVVLSSHTPGYDGDRLAARCREHLGCAALAGDLRLTATSGRVLRLGGWARWLADPSQAPIG